MPKRVKLVKLTASGYPTDVPEVVGAAAETVKQSFIAFLYTAMHAYKNGVHAPLTNDISAEFKVPSSTVCKWASGLTTPDPQVQGLVIEYIKKKLCWSISD
jgi:hypothetical protein